MSESNVITIDLGAAKRHEEESKRFLREYVDAMDESLRQRVELIEASDRAWAEAERQRLSRSSESPLAFLWYGFGMMLVLMAIVSLVSR